MGITKLIATIILTAAALLSLGMGPKINTASVPKERLLWPPPPSEPRIEFLNSIYGPEDLHIKKGLLRRIWESIAGESREGLVKPFGVFADEGKLYVTDIADRSVHVFDIENEKHFIIEGMNKQRFESPVGIAADSEGNIYVSDSIARRVYVFSKSGGFLREVGGDGRMERPTGIAVDKASETLYVVDTLAGKVLVYGLDGRYKLSFGEQGDDNVQFNRPTFIAIGRDGNLYVSDTMNVRIQVIDKTGKYISRFGKRGDGTGDMANPRGIAVDVNGYIYVTDTVFEVVQIFDRSGQLLLVFGKSGMENGEFSLPAGISISDDNKIYVADSYNSRVQVFRYMGKAEKR